jgi:2-oxoisovalerate dehydrogenase E2 component (dihydrolipoyl transacylase)
MADFTFPLPDVGEGLTEAEIVSWRVKPGDLVAVNQVVVEIETAKSLVELPSPFSGIVRELLVAEGDTVQVGSPIFSVQGEGGLEPVTPDTGVSEAIADTSSTVTKDAETPEVKNLVGYGAGWATRARHGARCCSDLRFTCYPGPTRYCQAPYSQAC